MGDVEIFKKYGLIAIFETDGGVNFSIENEWGEENREYLTPKDVEELIEFLQKN